jgi:outer membrane protein
MRTLLAILALTPLTALSQETLTLDQALKLARDSNGTVGAALRQYEIARSNVILAEANFWPTVTPTYRYVDQEQRFSGGFTGTGRQSFNQVAVAASWLVVDGGQRSFALARAKKSYEASLASARQTVRQVLFSTIQQYYDLLRAQELLKVADAQVKRAEQTLDATRRRVEQGTAPRKDILQAEADLANARVDQISARNAVINAQAALRASIGWPSDKPLPDLVDPGPPANPLPPTLTLDEAVQKGLSQRPDLVQSRRQREAQRYSLLSAQREASLDWTLSVDFTKNFEPNSTQNRSLTFLVTYPLFDAGRARETVRQSKLQYEAAGLQLQQQERAALSEIESAYTTWDLSFQRLQAAQVALEAARENFRAASESQSEGAASVLDVTTAQVALVTAETNYVQAVYDYYISVVRLNLATGEPLPGEEDLLR